MKWAITLLIASFAAFVAALPLSAASEDALGRSPSAALVEPPGSVVWQVAWQDWPAAGEFVHEPGSYAPLRICLSLGVLMLMVGTGTLIHAVRRRAGEDDVQGLARAAFAPASRLSLKRQFDQAIQAVTGRSFTSGEGFLIGAWWLSLAAVALLWAFSGLPGYRHGSFGGTPVPAMRQAVVTGFAAALIGACSTACAIWIAVSLRRSAPLQSHEQG